MREPKQPPAPSPAELDVLKLLWRTGPLSAREVHSRLVARTSWAYSTTRTTVDRMARKGLLQRRSFHGLNLYEPAISRVAGMAQLLGDFARDVLEVSRVPVAALFEGSDTLTPSEIRELRERLDASSKPKRGRP
jgi:predicted transcriptional regulator